MISSSKIYRVLDNYRSIDLNQLESNKPVLFSSIHHHDEYDDKEKLSLTVDKHNILGQLEPNYKVNGIEM
jgi:hypothetical protein